MDSEDFKEMREAGKLAKRAKAQNEYNKAWDWCYSKDKSIIKITEWQFRIDGTLDIFPQRNKYHDIKQNQRDTYTDLIQFLNKHFKV